MMQKTSKSQKW